MKRDLWGFTTSAENSTLQRNIGYPIARKCKALKTDKIESQLCYIRVKEVIDRAANLH